MEFMTVDNIFVPLCAHGAGFWKIKNCFTLLKPSNEHIECIEMKLKCTWASLLFLKVMDVWMEELCEVHEKVISNLLLTHFAFIIIGITADMFLCYR